MFFVIERAPQILYKADGKGKVVETTDDREAERKKQRTQLKV